MSTPWWLIKYYELIMVLPEFDLKTGLRDKQIVTVTVIAVAFYLNDLMNLFRSYFI